MLIFWKERLIFLANTRTGSSSIERSLETLAHVTVQRPPALKHLAARNLARHIAPLLEDVTGEAFTTVALMREPVDWVGSWYRYRQRDDIAVAAGSTGGQSFADFAEAYIAGRVPGFAAGEGRQDAPPLGRQCDFLADADGRLIVDRVFRYEDIAAFIAFLDDRLGCEIILPRLNVSPGGALRLPDDLDRRLHDHLAPDYAIYDGLARR
jgi:hypothetical protein